MARSDIDGGTDALLVGIDGRNLVSSLTGIGRYILGVSVELTAMGHELRFFMPHRSRTDLSVLRGSQISAGSFNGAVARAFWGQVALTSEVKRETLDVFWGPAHRLPPWLPNRMPRVLTVYDLVWQKVPQTMSLGTLLGEKLFFGSSLSRADVITSVSKSTASDIASAYPNLKTPVVTIPPGVSDLPTADDDETLRANGISGAFALFVGTVEPRKNLPRLLEAYSSLPELIQRRCGIVIAGAKGWEKSDLVRHAEGLGIVGNIRIIGQISDQALGSLYRQCRFLVLPSLYEGFGLPIIEANSMGAPVLTSNLSAMVEAVGDAGITVDPSDTHSIATAFSRLATDDEFRDGLAVRAIANAERYDWKTAAIRLEQAFVLARLRRQGS